MNKDYQYDNIFEEKWLKQWKQVNAIVKKLVKNNIIMSC